MRYAISMLTLVTGLITFGPAEAGNSMNIKSSRHTVAVTLDRFEAALREKGIAVVARVDHAAGASKVGMTLRPTQVLIFGNPKLGTPLMQSNPQIGLDLPLRVLAWEDAAGKVWVGYTAATDLASRYAIGDRAGVVQAMSEILDQLTTRATEP